MKPMTGRRLSLTVMVALALLLGASSMARARARAADKGRARALFFRGMKAFNKGNYPSALSLFLASNKLASKSVVIFNIAMCHRALFQYKRSIAAFGRYLKRKGRRIKPGRLRRVRRFNREMNRKLGRLVLAISPPGAQVKVDGEVVGVSPLARSVTIDPGKRLLEVSVTGYRTYTRTLEVLDGQRIKLSIRLGRVQGLRRHGLLVLSATAVGALGSVDGQRPRPLPLSVNLVEGRHRVRITAPGHRPRTMVLSIRFGEVVRRRAELEPLPGVRLRRALVAPRRRPSVQPDRRAPHATPFYRRAWFWTLVSAAVVGVGATTGYFIWAGSRPAYPYDERHLLR